ncbi:MAG TPA: hypothetical protein VJB39_02400 [Patescibacteria group bacterium]|nr:hypothetical protein [Patescibacteria group bacterium]
MISRINLVALAKAFFEQNLGQLPGKLLELLEQFKNSVIDLDTLRAELLKLGIKQDVLDQSFPQVIGSAR